MFCPSSALARSVAYWSFSRPALGVFGSLIAISILGGCDLRISGGSFWSNESTKLSPRIVELGQPVPKGGGRYKVGSPYRIHGKLYVPRQVREHERTGIASWYGELFHGRRTANGEIYDMEALTAAHPTLPLPSYARVTNLRNGRSLVVRVNDRGPYANDRIIDLSWAVASLLQMRKAGTAPVRVEYLGRAPLNGDESYERAVLARQRWAGPRVAYARSPAKAMRYAQASDVPRDEVARTRKTASLPALPAKEEQAPKRVSSSSPPMPASNARRGKAEGRKIARANRASVTPAQRAAIKPATNIVTTADPGLTTSAQQNSNTRPSKIETVTARPSPIYVEAGLFPQRPLAERLAAILTEIAPTTIEPFIVGNRPVHRIRLGPFSRREAAYEAAERIRAAGLKEAHIAKIAGG